MTHESNTDLTDELIDRCRSIAIEVARTAGAVLEDIARSGFTIEHKNPVNLVTDADRASEQAIVAHLHEAFPSHRILAEEEGLHAAGGSPFFWIIDPLDGTTNYAHGYPAYCVSIALEYRGRGILGVVFDPSRDELFVATRGGGATLNSAPITVSSTATLNDALVVTGFAYDIRENPENNLSEFSRVALKARGIRRTGSAALDLCYVACSRFDGYWELQAKPWDAAAGVVIVEEAGGRVTDCSGGPFSLEGQRILATNGRIHQELVNVLHRPPPDRTDTPE